MKHVLIALNPHAGAQSAARAISELARLLEGSGLKATIEPDLVQFAAKAAHLHAAGQLQAVVSAGGDGTAAAVANRLSADVPVAIYPLGTENLLARAIGQVRSPSAVHSTVTRGVRRELDVGLASGRMFLIMLSAGFDAAVVERAHELRRGHINRWHYFRPLHESVRRYRFPELKITATLAGDNPQTVRMRAKWAFAFNLPSYAAGLPIAPQAVGDDGALDLCTFQRGSIWHGLRYLTSVILRRHHRLADYATTRITRLKIESDEAVPYQVDGDPGGTLPVEIEVLPARLCLLVPP